MADIESIAEGVPPRVRGPGRPRLEESGRDPVVRQERMVEAEESQDIRSWLTSIGSQQDVAIKVYRKEPRVYKGTRIDGILATYNDFVDEEELKERFGGGQYQLVVHKRTPKGNLQFNAARTIRIAGPPRLEDDDETVIAPGRGDAVGQAMAVMQSQLLRAENRAERGERTGGMDPVLLRAITAPMEAQAHAASQQTIELQRQLAAKDERIIQVISSKPSGSEFQERLLANMLENESTRIEALRSQHQSEMRTLAEVHRGELARVHETARDELRAREKQYDRELETLKKQHDREVEALKNGQKAMLDGQKLGYDARIDGMKAENSRLERELQKLTLENAELKARKEKSIAEQAKELMGVRDTLKMLGGGVDDEDGGNQKWYQKILGQVADNPEAIGAMLGSIRGGGPPPPEPPQVLYAAPPPIRRKKLRPRPPMAGPAAPPPATASAGASAPAPVAPAGPAASPPPAAAAAAPRPAAPAPRRPAAPAAPPARPPDAEEVALAVGALEGAIANGTDPADFAQSARLLIPNDILVQLEKQGVDAFLNDVAQLSPGSVLRTQSGRNYARKVSRVLLEGAPG